MVEIEVFIVIDGDGEWASADDKESAIELYEEKHGALNECDGFRIVKTKIKVPLPVMIEVEAECEEVE